VRDLRRVVGGRLGTRERQQRIIPMINSNCSGSINKWTVAAKWSGGGNNINFPQLEIWRIQSACREQCVLQSLKDFHRRSS